MRSCRYDQYRKIQRILYLITRRWPVVLLAGIRLQVPPLFGSHYSYAGGCLRFLFECIRVSALLVPPRISPYLSRTKLKVLMKKIDHNQPSLLQPCDSAKLGKIPLLIGENTSDNIQPSRPNAMGWWQKQARWLFIIVTLSSCNTRNVYAMLIVVACPMGSLVWLGYCRFGFRGSAWGALFPLEPFDRSLVRLFLFFNPVQHFRPLTCHHHSLWV